MASVAGEKTAVVTPAGTEVGIRNGALRCVKRSTGFAMKWRPSIEATHRAISFTMPGQARNDYVHVMLDRSPDVRAAFLERHRKRVLTPAEQVDDLEAARIAKARDVDVHELRLVLR